MREVDYNSLCLLGGLLDPSNAAACPSPPAPPAALCASAPGMPNAALIPPAGMLRLSELWCLNV